MIEQVEAELARRGGGLQPGDVIRGFNGQPMYNPIALADFIRQHPHEELKLDVQRGSQPVRDCAASGAHDDERKDGASHRHWLGHDRAGDDRAPESDRTDLRQRHQHLEHDRARWLRRSPT